MKIKAFRALRPGEGLARKVAAVPYDVVNTEEARKLAEGNPLSFLHVSRPEIDFSPTQDATAPEVYAQGAEALKQLVNTGSLVREATPALYLYRQTMGDHQQTGLVACCHIDDYLNNVIKKHEKTRQDKEDDRTRHCAIVGAHTGPVFLTYRAQPELTARMAEACRQTPLYDFVAEDGVGHTVWRVADPDAWVAALHDIPVAYIADGHHRAAASVRTGFEMRVKDPAPSADASYNWFLAVLFPDEQLQVLPYHRLVADLNGLTPEAFLAEVKTRFTVTPAASGDCATESCTGGQCAMYCAGQWYKLQWAHPQGSPVECLDVAVLQKTLLAPILGIDDPRTNPRISFVGGIRGLSALTGPVDAGTAGVAFAMRPVTVAEVMAIADAGEVMPPKSTWFEPKLRSGLLVHTLDD